MSVKAVSMLSRWQTKPRCERLQKHTVQTAAQSSFCSTSSTTSSSTSTSSSSSSSSSSNATSLRVLEASLTNASLSPRGLLVSNLSTRSSRKTLNRDDDRAVEVGNSPLSSEEAGVGGQGRTRRTRRTRQQLGGKKHDERVLTATTTTATGSPIKRRQRMTGSHRSNSSPPSQMTTTVEPIASLSSNYRASRRQRLRDQRIARVKTFPTRPLTAAIEADHLTQIEKNADLLSHEDEIRLSNVYKKGCQLKSIRAQLAEKIGRKPSIAEWAEAAQLSRSSLQQSLKDYKDARQRIVNSNIRLVYHVARKLNWGSRLSLEDLVQEGVIGLLKAVDKYDPAKGYRFSTFAHWDIMSQIMRAKRDSRMVRLPAHIWSAVTKLNRAKVELKEGSTAPTPAQIAQKLDMTEKKVLQLESWARDVYELDRKTPGIKDNEGSPVLDLISSPDNDTFDLLEQMENGFLKISLEDVLETLPSNYGKVIRMRYGLDDSRPKTLAEIGKALNISSERVRQIEGRALRKLRQPERSQILEEFVI